MYLKSIVLKGFKSFPDRTKLEFTPGVSVIVGPNGSGKSNVTDAVLWALGEQSPVAVRGQSMQDVIFGGAPGRQAAKSAEVELVLDDSDGSLGLGAPEISIVRRLDRMGEGEYRLAGARCRLVDVVEFLSDTGLGKEMHSVISQGRVESIVTSKPKDRRRLIEEAAGLGKHRKRRRRAQLKLARTQDNLDRALDVEREARSRLRPLKRQAEAAELHARLQRQTLETRWELARDDLRANLLALDAAQGVASQARERREAVERELEVVAKRREAAEEALARRSAEREALSRRSYIAQTAAERVDERTDRARAAAATIDARVSRERELIAALSSEAETETPDPGAAGRIVALESERSAIERDRETEVAEQLAGLEQERSSAADLVAARTAELEHAAEARKQAEQELEGAHEALRDAERTVEETRREAARIAGELAAVNQFLSSRSPDGATVLAEQLEVDPGFELAVAAALDGRLWAAVVANRSDARALLDRAGSDGGRALIAGTAGRSRSDQETGAPMPGAERLTDHVRGGGDASTVAHALLRDAWLVDRLDAVPDTWAGVAVTTAGRVWSALTHEVRQVPAAGDEQALAERTRREQLARANDDAAAAATAARDALERAGAGVAELVAGRERAIASHREAITARDEAVEQQHRFDLLLERRRNAPDDGRRGQRRAQLEAELDVERRLLERVERERAERASRLERLRQALEHDDALRPALAALIEALDAVASAIGHQGAAFEAALAADGEAGEHVATELRTCAREEATLHARLHGENEAVTETEVGAQRARDQATTAEAELRELAARLDLPATPSEDELSADEREALSGRLERLFRRGEQLGPVNPLAQQEYADAVAHVEELEQQRADLETAMRELAKLIADTDRQIRETFEETFEAAARNFEELATQLFPGGRGRLRLVAEQEGAARVLGGAEPPAESDDGEAAIEAEAEALEEEEPMLGVEIEITPAGKDMKRLSLLSGGEKSMTALAFLFAVFLARPCPFYILDEVEAALDDLNIDRFLELLRRYSPRAQFIVVTHQKRTMEAADSLYGVSMGADGISKVISRRLPREVAA